MRMQDAIDAHLIITEYDALSDEKKDVLYSMVGISIDSPFTENQIMLFVSMMRLMSKEPARTTLLELVKDAGLMP